MRDTQLTQVRHQVRQLEALLTSQQQEQRSLHPICVELPALPTAHLTDLLKSIEANHTAANRKFDVKIAECEKALGEFEAHVCSDDLAAKVKDFETRNNELVSQFWLEQMKRRKVEGELKVKFDHELKLQREMFLRRMAEKEQQHRKSLK